MSYHLRKIEKGIFGHASKIREEYEEFQDAHDQGNPILELVELSDLIGAIEEYAASHYDIYLDDLIKMKDATNRAFESGHRVSNDPTIEDLKKSIQDLKQKGEATQNVNMDDVDTLHPMYNLIKKAREVLLEENKREIVAVPHISVQEKDLFPDCNCGLQYEEDYYQEQLELFPKITEVKFPQSMGKSFLFGETLKDILPKGKSGDTVGILIDKFVYGGK